MRRAGLVAIAATSIVLTLNRAAAVSLSTFEAWRDRRNQVLALFHVASTGRASGIPMTMETAQIYDPIDGKISQIRIFLGRSEALKAVGLEE